MNKYVNLVYDLIEKPRNELRVKVRNCNDKKLQKILDKYEEAYHRSCLKIEEYIDLELQELDLKNKR